MISGDHLYFHFIVTTSINGLLSVYFDNYDNDDDDNDNNNDNDSDSDNDNNNNDNNDNNNDNIINTWTQII